MLPNEADYGMTEQAFNNSSEQDTTGSVIIFSMKAWKDRIKSREMGRDIYVDKETVTWRPIGSRTEGWTKVVTDIHRKRWPKLYQDFLDRENTTEKIEGTPLSEWPQINRSLAEEYKYHNIFTVEQLTQVSDANLVNGMRSLREKAKVWLEAAELNVNAEKFAALEADNEAAKKQNELLQKRLAALESQVEQESISTPARPAKRKRRTKKEMAESAAVELQESPQTE